MWENEKYSTEALSPEMAMNVEVSWLYSVEWWPTNYIKILKLKLHWLIVSFLHTVAWSVCNIKTGIFPRSSVPRLNYNTNYFVLLRRKLSCCQYSTIIVFVLFSVNVMVSTHLCVVFHHFRCPTSLFQDHIAYWNLSQQGLSVCMSPRYSCLPGWFYM